MVFLTPELTPKKSSTIFPVNGQNRKNILFSTNIFWFRMTSASGYIYAGDILCKQIKKLYQ